ncbi:hypothetical protein P615_20315 [Brevibacillus laterosporus PE36]|nr:hypothetical protein P615_20315 [Brevibacillus laterosporus PE36]
MDLPEKLKLKVSILCVLSREWKIITFTFSPSYQIIKGNTFKGKIDGFHLQSED